MVVAKMLIALVAAAAKLLAVQSQVPVPAPAELTADNVHQSKELQDDHCASN